MNRQAQRTSFLIRIWREPVSPKCDDDMGAWRAQVTHVQSGASLYVDSIAALIWFIEQWIGLLHDKQPSHGCDDNDLYQP